MPLLGRHAVERGVARDAGIVDEDVDRARRGLDLGDARLARREISRVPLEDMDAGLGVEGLGGLVVAGVSRRHRATRGLERAAYGGPDPARASGNERHPCHLASLPNAVLLGDLSNHKTAIGNNSTRRPAWPPSEGQALLPPSPQGRRRGWGRIIHY